MPKCQIIEDPGTLTRGEISNHESAKKAKTRKIFLDRIDRITRISHGALRVRREKRWW
jgi:hypothetical protein